MYIDACGSDEEAYRITIVDFMKAGKVWPIVLLLRHIEGSNWQLLSTVAVLCISLLLHVFLSWTNSVGAHIEQCSSFLWQVIFLLYCTILFDCKQLSNLKSSAHRVLALTCIILIFGYLLYRMFYMYHNDIIISFNF